MAMLGTIFGHPNLAIALDNLGLDFTYMLVDEHADFLPARNDVFARLNNALRAKRICCAGEAQCGFRFLPRFQQGLVRPLGRERGVRLVFVHCLNRVEDSASHQRKALLKVFYWSHPVLLSSRLTIITI